jgi:GNAT superfamily N-acetyltransferase
MTPEALFPLEGSSVVDAGRGEPLMVRDDVRPGDVAAVTELASATGFFAAAEVAIAGELVEARLAQGLASGYRFVFAERAGRLEGYCCYGPVPLTQSSFDLYWIVVHPAAQRTGLGRRLLSTAETTALGLGGTAMYVDTSSRAQYTPTRLFYRRLGYRLAAEFPDFYAPGDGKVVFIKRLTS